MHQHFDNVTGRSPNHGNQEGLETDNAFALGTGISVFAQVFLFVCRFMDDDPSQVIGSSLLHKAVAVSLYIA